MENYVIECRSGREKAAALIHDINDDNNHLPSVMAEIRKMASDQSGVGVGFLTVIAEMAISARDIST